MFHISYVLLIMMNHIISIYINSVYQNHIITNQMMFHDHTDWCSKWYIKSQDQQIRRLLAMETGHSYMFSSCLWPCGNVLIVAIFVWCPKFCFFLTSSLLINQSHPNLIEQNIEPPSDCGQKWRGFPLAKLPGFSSFEGGTLWLWLTVRRGKSPFLIK